jgi:hypothetical protein
MIQEKTAGYSNVSDFISAGVPLGLRVKFHLLLFSVELINFIFLICIVEVEIRTSATNWSILPAPGDYEG